MRTLLAFAAFLTGIAVFAGLGTWQVQRLHWKEGLIATIEARIHGAPQPLAEIERRYAQTGDVEVMPVHLTGRFVHAGERFLLSTFDGDAGWNVYTPLVLADGRAVFVNRGFVPYAGRDPATRRQGLVEGEVSIEGLARNPLAGPPSSMTPDNDPAKNTFFWKDIASMSVGSPLPAGTAVLPFFVDAGSAPNPGGYPVGATTLIDLPNSHLQYAVTWFGLAAVLVVLFVLFLQRRRRDGMALRAKG